MFCLLLCCAPFNFVPSWLLFVNVVVPKMQFLLHLRAGAADAAAGPATKVQKCIVDCGVNAPYGNKKTLEKMHEQKERERDLV